MELTFLAPFLSHLLRLARRRLTMHPFNFFSVRDLMSPSGGSKTAILTFLAGSQRACCELLSSFGQSISCRRFCARRDHKRSFFEKVTTEYRSYNIISFSHSPCSFSFIVSSHSVHLFFLSPPLRSIPPLSGAASVGVVVGVQTPRVLRLRCQTRNNFGPLCDL